MSKNIYDYDLGKKYIVFKYYREFAANYIYIRCPFCNVETKAYIWSLAGSGKKCCKCGSKHTWFGITYPLKNK